MENLERHPFLKGRGQANHPNDIKVLIHDGGPKITEKCPELAWVTITGLEDRWVLGRIITEPKNLNSVFKGAQIKLVAFSTEYPPVLVTDKYIAESAKWEITPCDSCGFTDLFDAPSDLIKASYPNIPEDTIVEIFTSFCGVCGGIQVSQMRGVAAG